MAATALGHPALPWGWLQNPGRVRKGLDTRGPGLKALTVSVCLSVDPSTRLCGVKSSQSHSTPQLVHHHTRYQRFNSLTCYCNCLLIALAAPSEPPGEGGRCWYINKGHK